MRRTSLHPLKRQNCLECIHSYVKNFDTFKAAQAHTESQGIYSSHTRTDFSESTKSFTTAKSSLASEAYVHFIDVFVVSALCQKLFEIHFIVNASVTQVLTKAYYIARFRSETACTERICPNNIQTPDTAKTDLLGTKRKADRPRKARAALLFRVNGL